MPFTEMSGGITVLFERFRDDRVLGAQSRSSRSDGIDDAVAVRVATGEQSRAGRRTNGLWHMKAGVLNSLSGEALHIRGGVRRFSEGVEIRVGRVIEENEDDVRALGCKHVYSERQ
jgi:hypothetical protein